MAFDDGFTHPPVHCSESRRRKSNSRVTSLHDRRETPYVFPAKWNVDRLSDALITAHLSVDGLDELSEESWVDSISLSGIARWHVDDDLDEPESPPGGRGKADRRRMQSQPEPITVAATRSATGTKLIIQPVDVENEPEPSADCCCHQV